ncbi:hypothetical protein NDU88_002894 [Pleurodeles waltl]|uniref:Uncharacterized protein n=1 Tax=Pleurodeles waltl TaxID=8319 RepID=A0AAV7Q822_PLEWA|nr:hypothetical protein NDU88_002894 [Pleurodeles waltl]
MDEVVKDRCHKEKNILMHVPITGASLFDTALETLSCNHNTNTRCPVKSDEIKEVDEEIKCAEDFDMLKDEVVVGMKEVQRKVEDLDQKVAILEDSSNAKEEELDNHR